VCAGRLRYRMVFASLLKISQMDVRGGSDASENPPHVPRGGLVCSVFRQSPVLPPLIGVTTTTAGLKRCLSGSSRARLYYAIRPRANDRVPSGNEGVPMLAFGKEPMQPIRETLRRGSVFTPNSTKSTIPTPPNRATSEHPGNPDRFSLMGPVGDLHGCRVCTAADRAPSLMFKTWEPQPPGSESSPEGSANGCVAWSCRFGDVAYQDRTVATANTATIRKGAVPGVPAVRSTKACIQSLPTKPRPISCCTQTGWLGRRSGLCSGLRSIPNAPGSLCCFP